MEEVVGSIPTRSTSISFINRYVPTLASCSPAAQGCGRVLKFLHFLRQHQFNDFQARFALLLVHSAGVNIKGRPTARVAHQLLKQLTCRAHTVRLNG